MPIHVGSNVWTQQWSNWEESGTRDLKAKSGSYFYLLWRISVFLCLLTMFLGAWLWANLWHTSGLTEHLQAPRGRKLRYINKKNGQVIPICQWCILHKTCWSFHGELLEMIDTLSKVTEYKIKLEKPVSFLFIGIKHGKREVTAMLHSQ